jgi:hypothetical protein
MRCFEQNPSRGRIRSSWVDPAEREARVSRHKIGRAEWRLALMRCLRRIFDWETQDSGQGRIRSGWVDPAEREARVLPRHKIKLRLL